MSRPRRGVALTPMETRRPLILAAARLADELGYEVFSVAEGWGLDATLLLAEIGASTRRITLATGVLSIWGRSAGTIAMSAATLHQICGGRVILGLGASTRQLAAGFHDVPYDRPAGQLRAVTLGVRALLAGEPARTAGQPTARPIRLAQAPVPDLPIWIAASGERTVRVAAELADGWFPLFLRPGQLRGRLGELASLRTTAGVRHQPLTVACGPFTVVDDDVAAARAVAAACMARYLTSMGERYPRLVSEQGYAAEVDLVRAANSAPGGDRGVVPADAQPVLDEFTAYGSAPAVRERLEQWDRVADVTVIALPPGLPWPRIEATLRAAAP